MSCKPTNSRRMAAPASSKPNMDINRTRDPTPEGFAQPPESIVRRTDDKLFQKYIRYLYDPEVLPRLKAIANTLASRLNGRRIRGSAEFQQEASDLFNNAFSILCASRQEFISKEEFCKAFANGMENQDRWRRRSQSARVQLDGSPEANEDRINQRQGYVFSFPCPEMHASNRRDLEMIHHAVLAEAPDLEQLILALLSGNLKPVDLIKCLGIDRRLLDSQRERLRQLAERTLNRKR